MYMFNSFFDFLNDNFITILIILLSILFLPIILFILYKKIKTNKLRKKINHFKEEDNLKVKNLKLSNNYEANKEHYSKIDDDVIHSKKTRPQPIENYSSQIEQHQPTQELRLRRPNERRSPRFTIESSSYDAKIENDIVHYVDHVTRRKYLLKIISLLEKDIINVNNEINILLDYESNDVHQITTTIEKAINLKENLVNKINIQKKEVNLIDDKIYNMELIKEHGIKDEEINKNFNISPLDENNNQLNKEIIMKQKKEIYDKNMKNLTPKMQKKIIKMQAKKKK